MELQSTREGLTAVAEAAGIIDTRASQEFERQLVGLFDAGVRSVIIDLSKVDLITSAGIRVLVMMAQRLQRSGGALVLCALSDNVRGIFDVAGLLKQFRIAATRAEAVSQLASVHSTPAAAPPAPLSKVARLVTKVLAEDGSAIEPPPAGNPAAPSALTTQVLELLRAAAPGGAGAKANRG